MVICEEVERIFNLIKNTSHEEIMTKMQIQSDLKQSKQFYFVKK